MRGCAHAGVIEVLREAQVPIDLVVGSSIGSMFGLAVAAEWPTEPIVRSIRDSDSLALFRFYAGRLRTDRSNPIARLLQQAGGGKAFEDLPIPFAVTATDMETGSVAVLKSGPVLPAVEASIALPFIARPVELGGRVYVDGGIFDTVPVPVARQLGAEVVIAVCLGYNYHAPAPLRHRPWTQGFLHRAGRQQRPATTRLRDQLRFGCRMYAATFDPPLPSAEADVTIWPDLGTLSPNSLRGIRFCYEQGVQATRAALPAITRLLAGSAALRRQEAQ